MTHAPPWIWAFVLYARYVKVRPATLQRRILARCLGPILRYIARILPFPPANALQPITPKPMPRIIWMFWADGEAKVPDIVRRCIDSWREMNPEWDVRVLDNESAKNWSDLEYVPSGTRIQLVADALRLELLRQYGGVWADATCLCTRPLDDWLIERIDKGFFAFSSPGPDRPLSNWFLASPPNGYLVSAWALAGRAYWETGFYSNHIGPNGRRDQFLYHYLFDWMIYAYPKLAALWSSTHYLSARPSHYVQACMQEEEPLHDMRAFATEALKSENVPVHKLNWRIQNGAEKLDEILQAMRG